MILILFNVLIKCFVHIYGPNKGRNESTTSKTETTYNFNYNYKYKYFSNIIFFQLKTNYSIIIYKYYNGFN